MVAKTYQTMPLIGEPFDKNGKMYIKVQTKSSIKEVRWYSEKEYAKLYPDQAAVFIPTFDISYMLKAFGFDKGYIDILKEEVPYNDEAVCDFNRQEKCFQYSELFGWFIKHENDLTKYFNTVRIYWDNIKNCKSFDEIQAYCAAARGEKVKKVSTSTYQYDIGDRKTLMLDLIKVEEHKDFYGTKYTYTFEHDTTGNLFVWTTAAAELEANNSYEVTGTVKEHKTVDGIEMTVLTRCKVK